MRNRLLIWLLLIAGFATHAQDNDATLKATVNSNIRGKQYNANNMASVLDDLIDAKMNLNYGAVATGTDNYTVSFKPSIYTTYTSGDAFVIDFANVNTGASTININSIGDIDVVKNGEEALEGGELSGYRWVIFDGTNFQLASGSGGGVTVPQMMDSIGGSGVKKAGNGLILAAADSIVIDSAKVGLKSDLSGWLTGTLTGHTTIDGAYDFIFDGRGDDYSPYFILSSFDETSSEVAHQIKGGYGIGVQLISGVVDDSTDPINAWNFPSSTSARLHIDHTSGFTFESPSGTTFNFNVPLVMRPIGLSSGDGGRALFTELAANGTNTVGFKAPDAIGSNVLWTLPNADGSSGNVLSTNGSGVLSWAAPSGTAGIGTSGTTYLTGHLFIDGVSDTYGTAFLNHNYFAIQSSQGLEIEIMGSRGSAGQVLTSDGSHVTWQDPDVSLADLISRTVPTTDTGNTISFSALTIYNTPSSPDTGAGTNVNLTGAKTGIIQKLYQLSSSTPDWPAGWVCIGGTYSDTELNIIYCEWVSGTRVEYWITQEQ